MEEKEENKKRIDVNKYLPINSKEVVDQILEDMKTNKIFPSDNLKAFLLQKIGKVKIQLYLSDKFKETKDKIENKIKKNSKRG